MYYNTKINFILDRLRNGESVKLTPILDRKPFELIGKELSSWYPVVMAAAAYYDAVTSNLPDDAEKLHKELIDVIRVSGLV